ncbi:IS1 family transposase [Escherichia coli]
MPGSSLLSHGETPHYHRRYGVSLQSVELHDKVIGHYLNIKHYQ